MTREEERKGHIGDKRGVNMKLTEEMRHLINGHLLIEFFRENAIPDLKDALPEQIDSIHGVEEKLEEFLELIEKKAMEAAEKEAEELANG